ncbi:MAG: response regulator, partial [Oscillospiraceae bacterium]
MSSFRKIKVLIVDDSIFVRKTLETKLGSDPHIEVVGTATDPFDAMDKIKQLNPDVLTIDIEMPKMNGINFLKQLMQTKPIPVI